MPPDSTVKDLDSLHAQARSARGKLEPSWFMNLSYYEGSQWMAWNGRQLVKPSMPRNRITIVDNRIMPAVRTEIARMTKQRPIFQVTPRTSDEEDANAAEMGEQLMRYLWKHLDLNALVFKALQWSRICGAGFLKSYWDSTIGEKVQVLVGPNGQVLTGADGRPVSPGMIPDLPGVQAKTVAQGDMRVEVRSPFQMFPDPLADSFSECEWLIEESIKSQEYVRRRYGVDIKPDAPANPGLLEARMGSSLPPGGGGYKGVKVREYWCKPNTTHPNGCRTVWVHDQVLETDSQPFDPMPYIMLSGIPIPGRLWPTSIAEQLRGPQTELNKVKSQIAENRNRVGNPTILASKQAVQDPEKFIASMTLPGGVSFYDDVGSPNAVPKFLEAPQLPPYVVEEIQRIEESIQEISGQHEVASAQVPPGVTAASAINLLQEADDTQLGPSMDDYEYQLGRLGQKLLRLAAEFYTDARTIKIAGDNGNWQIFDFRGTMLRDNTQVEVQAGSAFPQSKAAKQAMLNDLMTFFVQSGNPPQGRQLAQLLQDLELGATSRLIEQFSVDETQCNRENILLSQGQQLPINTYDNNQAHVDNHEEFQKQARYAQLPPQIKQIFEQHVDLHRQTLQQQQQQQLEMQMQMQGQVPPALSAAALQDQHELSQLQGQQQLQLQSAQGQQQQGQAAQQQGFSAAQAEQQQRQAEELHQQKLSHQQQLHDARLRQMSQSQSKQGVNRGR